MLLGNANELVYHFGTCEVPYAIAPSYQGFIDESMDPIRHMAALWSSLCCFLAPTKWGTATVNIWAIIHFILLFK